MKNEIILFENQNVKLEVNMQDETVWLSIEQMTKLFDRDRTVITRHIQNIYKDEELDENSVCSYFEHTAKDGKKYNVQFYNLDMIISVVYFLLTNPFHFITLPIYTNPLILIHIHKKNIPKLPISIHLCFPIKPLSIPLTPRQILLYNLSINNQTSHYGY